jgi:AraC-like DNA-binding protein
MSFVAPPECGAWETVKHGWRKLYGNFHDGGVSFEQHEFSTSRPLNWGRSFHHDSLELCLNLSGQGVVRNGREESVYTNRTVGFYCNWGQQLAATRAAKETHSFITLELSRPYMQAQLEPMADSLQPVAKKWLQGEKFSGLGVVNIMSSNQTMLYSALTAPPVSPAAYGLWYQSKALELLAQVIFAAPPRELFCHKQKRVARERIERAVAVLQANISAPPDIATLGAQVGCSPFYLSRLFSRETGMTIPQFLRQIRMERAAELLLEGRHNVTEAAAEVGYSSLSHFSKAFCQTIGCCPVLFPKAQNLVEKFLKRPRIPLFLEERFTA